MKRICLILTLAVLTCSLDASAQMKRSPKRGMCENNPHYTRTWGLALKAGVSWTYNWGVAPEPDELRSGTPDGIRFAPMCWNHQFDETKLRKYLNTHPEAEILLGFNEPNFTGKDGGSNITPSVAASHWPKLEKIAEEYDLKLVSPAMSFGYEALSDGKVWGLDEWLGAFIEEYRKANDGRDPRMDYIALHTYMNWASSVEWFVNSYLYADDRDSRLRDYFSRTGRKQIFLTEFSAGEGDKDGFTTTEDSQIDEMVKKVQLLEQSDNVAGYAWFMGIGGSFTNSYPYWHVFTGSDSNLQITELGRIYANMSSFDKTCYWKPGQLIPAKDYIDMSECKLRHNTDKESDQKIELSQFQQYKNWENKTITPYVEYQINVGTRKSYTLSLRLCNDNGTTIEFVVDGRKVVSRSLTTTNNEWATRTVLLALTPGLHTLRLNNVKQSNNKMNWLRIEGTEDDCVEEPTAITAPREAGKGSIRKVTFSDLTGRRLASPTRGVVIRTTTYDDGTTRNEKIIQK